MLYCVIHIQTSFAEDWQKDLFDQQLCDLGVDTIDGEDYYIPTDLWQQNQAAVTEHLSALCFPFSVSEVPDENWNAAWEAEHPVQQLPLGVTIIPHCAFGAGHHETTSMMINALMEADLEGKTVLDHGTGTGVLAIFAKRLGAKQVVAVDIDEKAVANAKENALLNNVEIDVRLGDSIPTPSCGELEKGYDLILANIHRNILLANMPTYAHHLAPGGELWLSGFYESDCTLLKDAAEAHGLTLIDIRASGEWRWMRCQNTEHRPGT
ncbi:MAG: 50S ribosomal protein L11 methyltransferase [Paludibacteraceae bacterium]|nr:50S ribosomal protein L11 methyltransferase [Paludibacteraceae bacterium]